MTHGARKKLIILHLAILLLLTLISYRKILLSGGVIGHNWDWTIPYFPVQMMELAKYGKYLWYEYAMGTSASIAQTSSLVYMIEAIFGKLGLGGSFFTKTLVLYVSFFSSSFFYFVLIKFLSYLKAENVKSMHWAALLGAVYYGFSPFLFNELNGGALSKLLSYPAIPIFLFFALKYLLEERFISPNWIASSLSLVLIATAFQNFILASFSFGLIVVFFVFTNKNIFSFVKAVLIYILFTLYSLYWILPTLATLGYAVREFVQKELFSESTLTFNVPEWYEILIGTGYFREFFTFGSSTFLRPFIFLFGFLLLILIVVGIYLSRKTSKFFHTAMLFFCVYYLLAIIPALGAKVPFGRVIIYLYRNIGFFNLFRSPQHFILQVVLALTFLLCLSAYIIYIRTKHQNIVIACSFIVLIIFLNSYFVRGDIASSHFKTFRLPGNYVDLYKYPTEYLELIQKLKKDQTSVNTAFLPSSYSPYYLKNEFQHYGQGGDPFLLTTPQGYIAQTFITSKNGLNLIAQFEDEINKKGVNQNTLKYLQMLGVKYIILRNDIIPNFGNYALSDNYTALLQALDSNFNGQQFSNMRLYEIEPSPRIYASNNIKIISNSYSDEINYENILNLTQDNSILVQIPNTNVLDSVEEIFTMSKLAYGDTLSFVIETDDTYYAEVIQEAYYNALAPVIIQQVDCIDEEKEISEPITTNLENLHTQGQHLTKGCYSVDTSRINKKLLFTMPQPVSTKSAESLNLGYEITTHDLDINHSESHYFIDFSYETSNNKKTVNYIWTKVCTDPESFVINLNSKNCKYDYLNAIGSDKENRVRSAFRISGSKLNVDKGIAFRGQEPVKITRLQLFEVKNPIVTLHTKKTEVKNKHFIDIEFTRINPTKYLVHVKNTPQNPFLIYFGQNYDDGWILRSTKYLFNNTDSLFNYTKYLSQEVKVECSFCFIIPNFRKGFGTHVKANTFANGWIIDPNSQEYTNTFVIEFQPQESYKLGLYLSTFFLVGSIFLLAMHRLKKQ